ncbi:MAG: polyprenyl synthetase family protein [Elusimicrobia bacterium]|nr:polyprenyl synthetase family protein [Elusimicrobiota bacterium]
MYNFNVNIESFLSKRARIIDRELKKFINNIDFGQPKLIEAMLYSINAGGKRIRPVLATAAYEIFKPDFRRILPAACSLEMIHTYSLIHDDLPAMDDDNFRRGIPTNHKVYGEGLAVLAGDALLTNAFNVLAMNSKVKGIKPGNVLKAVEILSAKAGAGGMAGGQAADLEAEGYPLEKRFSSAGKLLNYIHLHKTADLIQAGVQIGAVLADAPEKDCRILSNAGRMMGLAFQIVDDVLDVTADKKKLGKSGSDARNKKLTYVSMYGIEKSLKKAEELLDRTRKELSLLKRPASKVKVIEEIAGYICRRDR